MTSPTTLLAAPHAGPSAPVQQQMDLLQRTVAEYAQAVSETTGAAASHDSLPEATVVAQLRRARLEIRAQTGLVRTLPYRRDDRAS